MTRKIGLLPFVIFVTFVPQPRTSVWGGLGEPSESTDGGAISQIDPLRAIHRQPQHRDQPHLRLSPVLFPPPVAQGICGLSRLQGSNKNEVGKPASLLVRLAKPTLPQHLGLQEHPAALEPKRHKST